MLTVLAYRSLRTVRSAVAISPTISKIGIIPSRMSILLYLVAEIGVMSVLLALVGVCLSNYANDP